MKKTVVEIPARSLSPTRPEYRGACPYKRLRLLSFDDLQKVAGVMGVILRAM